MKPTPIDIHKDIVEECKNGSRKAQYQLYQLYSKAMFNICFRMMNDKEEAEDRLQESFVYAFKKLETFRFESTFGAWLKTIVINNCINAIKKKKAELVFVEDVNIYEEKKEEEVDFEQVELTVQKIQKAISLLPEGGRIVLSLYLLEGYDHVEIAEILKITESTSKSQYMRAKRRVLELIKNNEI